MSRQLTVEAICCAGIVYLVAANSAGEWQVFFLFLLVLFVLENVEFTDLKCVDPPHVMHSHLYS